MTQAEWRKSSGVWRELTVTGPLAQLRLDWKRRKTSGVSREFTVTGLLAQLRYSYRAACFGRCVLMHIREKFRRPSGPQSIQNGEHIDDFLKDRPGDRVQ